MSTTGLLVVSNTRKFRQTLSALDKCLSALYIHLHIPADKVQPAPAWGRLISQLYMDSRGYCGQSRIDMRILVGPLKQPLISGEAIPRLRLRLRLPIDTIYSDSDTPELCEQLREQLSITNQTVYLQQESMDIGALQTHTIEQNPDEGKADHRTYETVVLGGTFDRIHAGHKIFLTQAVLRATRRLVVGVTSAEMTKSKTLAELILPVEQRIKEVRDFLMEIDASLQYDVVRIDDPFGPTQSDPDMNMIVVSAETLRGGHKVNELRAKNQLRPLEIFCIDMVESCDAESNSPKETKISSSNTRLDLLGMRIRKPTPRPQLPAEPYIIGLTGGIASGKSSIAQYLRNLGAVVLDCDKVAHDVYEPGQVCHERIVKCFGDAVLDAQGRIDRAKLGAIVFSDAQQLEALNAIVWPELMLELKRRIQAALQSETPPRVVVLEAAVLLKAGWQNECHEIWATIVPPQEAVRRVMERNALSEEEARKRLASQLSNAEIVGKAHVVFSSQWDAAFTRAQAEKAWQMLMRELDAARQANSML